MKRPVAACDLKTAIDHRLPGGHHAGRTTVMTAADVRRLPRIHARLGASPGSVGRGREGRAAYGRQVLEALSLHLGSHYGRGFSVTNLKHF